MKTEKKKKFILHPICSKVILVLQGKDGTRNSFLGARRAIGLISQNKKKEDIFKAIFGPLKLLHRSHVLKRYLAYKKFIILSKKYYKIRENVY